MLSKSTITVPQAVTRISCGTVLTALKTEDGRVCVSNADSHEHIAGEVPHYFFQSCQKAPGCGMICH